MKKKNIFALAFAAIFITIVVLALVFRNHDAPNDFVAQEIQAVEIPPPSPVLFGITLDTLEAIKSVVKTGDTFGKLLGEQGLETAEIYNITEITQKSYDLRKLQIGKNYTLVKGKKSGKLRYFIYEESMLSYLVVHLADSVYAEERERKLTIENKTIKSAINGSLYETITSQGGNATVAVKLADIYAWSVDFFRIQAGDSVAVMYEDLKVDDTIYAGVGKILAAKFYHQGRPFYAFRYTTNDGETDYFDQTGKTMRRAFLKAPLQFSRISSKFTMKRFHPVQKRWKAHLGTDYAAPSGTPIMTTSDGVVEKSGYTSGNGNYVKVKHNSTYSTQYLHMSKIAPGMKSGKRVRQGDVIGYVGSTGLATGPHVCYRFWKNGVQVDPLNEKLPEAKEIDEKYRQAYLDYINTNYSNILSEA